MLRKAQGGFSLSFFSPLNWDGVLKTKSTYNKTTCFDGIQCVSIVACAANMFIITKANSIPVAVTPFLTNSPWQTTKLLSVLTTYWLVISYAIWSHIWLSVMWLIYIFKTHPWYNIYINILFTLCLTIFYGYTIIWRNLCVHSPANDSA